MSKDWTAGELLEECKRLMPMDGVPEAAQSLVWLQAWERGRDGGTDAVFMAYDDLRAVALLAAGVRDQ